MLAQYGSHAQMTGAQYGTALLNPYSPAKYHLTDSTTSSSCWGCLGDVKFLLPFDSRFSLITDPIKQTTKIVKVFGFKLGLQLYKNFRFGLGFYAQRQPIHSQLINQYSDTVAYTIGFQYSTVYFEYVLYNDFRWEVSLPVQLGIGSIPIKVHSALLDSITMDTSFALPVASIGIGGHYKFIPWLGIGAGLGYRRMLIKDEVANKTFSKPFVALKLKLFIGPLYRCIFKPDIIKAEREEYNRMRREKFELKQQRRSKRKNK